MMYIVVINHPLIFPIETLLLEQETYHDIVFRGDWCPFMLNRHHHSINYGNAVVNSTDEELALGQWLVVVIVVVVVVVLMVIVISCGK